MMTWTASDDAIVELDYATEDSSVEPTLFTQLLQNDLALGTSNDKEEAEWQKEQDELKSKETENEEGLKLLEEKKAFRQDEVDKK